MNHFNLINIINPQPNSTILIYDVHASETGALSILDDLYKQIVLYPDKSIKWIFAISTPTYDNTDNIIVLRFPWVKKNWLCRFYFDIITTKNILKEYSPDKVLSLQNKGISFFGKEQFVYLHLPTIFKNHRFTIRDDGIKIWFYQNILSKSIFSSLKKVNGTIVQTKWMKNELIKKLRIESDKIFVIPPDISVNNIGNYCDTVQNRKHFFYPAASYHYKNHLTLLKAISYAQDKGLKDYEVLFTITADENQYTQKLYQYATEHNLKIKFNGPLTRENVFKQYEKSVLLFPSYVESFGLPLLEARLTGCPIIASDCPFCHEILENYDKVLYFQEMDWVKMGEHILALQNAN